MINACKLLRTVSKIQYILTVIIIITASIIICKNRILFFSINFLIRVSGKSSVVRMKKEEFLLTQWKCSHQDPQVFLHKSRGFTFPWAESES